MYMNSNGYNSQVFTISGMTAPTKITAFGENLGVVSEATIDGAERIGLVIAKKRPEAKIRIAIPEGGRDAGMVVLNPSTNRSFFYMVEELDVQKVELGIGNRYFLYNSDTNPKRYVLSTEPPHWLEARDIHFLVKYGKPAREFPEKQMSLDEMMFYPLRKMQESLSVPGYSVEEALNDAAEEMLDMNVVCVDEETGDPEDYDGIMEKLTKAKCSYADLAASLRLLLRAETHKRYRETTGGASASEGDDK